MLSSMAFLLFLASSGCESGSRSAIKKSALVDQQPEKVHQEPAVNDSVQRFQAALNMCKTRVEWWAGRSTSKASYSRVFINNFAVKFKVKLNPRGAGLGCVVLDANGTVQDDGLDTTTSSFEAANLAKLYTNLDTRASQEDENFVKTDFSEDFAETMCSRAAVTRFQTSALAEALGAWVEEASASGGAHGLKVKVSVSALDKFDVRTHYWAYCSVQDDQGTPGNGTPVKIAINSVDRDLSDITDPDRLK